MYSKKDHVEHFLKMDISELGRQRIEDLFLNCIKNDSFLIALQIYLRHLKTLSLNVIRALISSIRNSSKFFEIKLFFIHEHFRVMKVEEMNRLIDTLLIVLKTKDLV